MPDDWRGELIEGELVMAPAPVPYHQHLVSELVYLLRDHFGSERWRAIASPLDVDVDRHNVFQPDVVVLPADVGPPAADWNVPLPVWVIEILSPSTAMYDRYKKLPKMADAGVREAWLIAPRRAEVEIHDLEIGKQTTYGRADRVRSLTIPGFELGLDAFFGASGP